MSGKTTLIFEILKRTSEKVDKEITNIQFIYSIEHPQFFQHSKLNPKVKFPPSIDEHNLKSSTLVEFDDQMTDFETCINKFVTNFFTRSVHHIGYICILVLHNAFAQKKTIRIYLLTSANRKTIDIAYVAIFLLQMIAKRTFHNGSTFEK